MRGSASLQGKRVIVVGGAGFIGSHVVEELLKHDVALVTIYDNFCRGTRSNLKAALADPRCTIYDIGGDICQSDILDAAIKGHDHVVHLAALWLLQCHDYPQAAFDVNIRGTFNVLQSCVRQNITRLVYSSSASVYGDAAYTPMDENHPFANQTFYGATKIAGEQMLRAFHYRFGLSFAGLRYMNVYGPRQDYKGAYIAVIMKMLDRLDKNEAPTVFGDGSQTYDFVYVADAARANVCALTAPIDNEFFNVGSGVGTTIKELAQKVLNLTGSPLRPQFVEEGQTFVTHRVGSTKLAREKLGFTSEVTLDEGLSKLINWRKSDQLAYTK